MVAVSDIYFQQMMMKTCTIVEIRLYFACLYFRNSLVSQKIKLKDKINLKSKGDMHEYCTVHYIVENDMIHSSLSK